MDHHIVMRDGRRVGVAEFGSPLGTAVLWCHGGPGSRLEPMWLDRAAAAAGLRIVGADRPGYGLSTPKPGRTVTDVVADMITIADHLSLERFVTVGVSTGGAYALALAALVPDRVLGVVACCSVTDMSWAPGRATMSQAHAQAVWDAPDREAAIAAAVEAHGENGSKLIGGGMDAALADSDKELFADPTWMADAMSGFPQMFTYGLQGYADDRIADNAGWAEFDVTQITCPVTVLHGTEDRMADPIHARHTAELVPDAELVLIDGLGHFSIEAHILPEVTRLLRHPPIDASTRGRS
jgi:pimeloyl-ACP methyl ester carboxylesterase